MKEWLLSIIGVVFLGVLFDLIIPNGKTNNLCKSIFGIFAVFVMISPILKIDINSVFSNSVTENSFYDDVHKAREKVLLSIINERLTTCNIFGVNVEINSYFDDGQFVLENIYIDCSDLVLTENITNINKYEVIAKEVSNITNIDKEKVIVYG